MPLLMNETEAWAKRIVPEQIDRYLSGGRDFINDDHIHGVLRDATPPSPARLEEILAKSLAVETLTPEETAELICVTDPALRASEVGRGAGGESEVYSPRTITVAPPPLRKH